MFLCTYFREFIIEAINIFFSYLLSFLCSRIFIYRQIIRISIAYITCIFLNISLYINILSIRTGKLFAKTQLLRFQISFKVETNKSEIFIIRDFSFPEYVQVILHPHWVSFLISLNIINIILFPIPAIIRTIDFSSLFIKYKASKRISRPFLGSILDRKSKIFSFYFIFF